MANTPEDYAYIPLDKACNPPPGNIHHFVNRWWAVDLKKGIMFYKRGLDRFPQCNSDPEISNHVAKTNCPWASVVFLPNVFVRLDVNGDFDYLVP